MSPTIDFKAVSSDDRACRSLMIAIFDGIDENREHLIRHLGEGTAETVLELIETHRISGSYKALNLLPGDRQKHGFDWLLFMGLGKKKEIRHIYRLHDRIRSVVAIAAREFRDKHISAFAVDDFAAYGVPAKLAGQLVVEGATLGTYRFERYKGREKSESDGEGRCEIEQIQILTNGQEEALQAAIERGVSRCAGTCMARDLVNTPAADLTPATFAEEARRVAKANPTLRLQVLSAEDMQRLGMGLHLAVAQGSENAPCVVILEHCPRGAEAGWDLVMVGKGVTFDSGGYNIKPGNSMTRMYGDMAGAAAVLGAMQVIAEAETDVNVVGVMPLAENLVSGHAFKPGDILVSHSGKTVEILNTDAEGRLLMADSLSYACERYKPHHMVDIATLTGAIVVALGHFVSGLFTHANERTDDDAFTSLLYAAGRGSAEWLWRLPVDDDYKVQLESEAADIANCNLDRATGAGAITAAVFLKEFIDFDTVTAWAHLDIAASALVERALIYNKCPYQPKAGATGVGVRLLAGLAEELLAKREQGEK
jgi:leucyl aminopeptidase